jgi:hypothetical protein
LPQFWDKILIEISVSVLALYRQGRMGLHGCGDEEKIWAYNNNRVLWSAGNSAEILDK